MNIGHFYFIDFPDDKLMRNHEKINGIAHNRPCLYAFQDTSTGIYWAVPFSSKVEKYKNIYNKKIAERGTCDTIDFGYVLGYEKAFLIQNMCPLIDDYIKSEYFSNGVAVQLNYAAQKRIISKAKKVLQLYRQGKPIIFPDVLKIEKELINRQMSGNELISGALI